MLETITQAMYSSILRGRQRDEELLHKYYGQCVHTLVSRWAAIVTPHQLAILLFVFDRTFYHSKLSETVVFDQFLHGMVRTTHNEMVFCGLKMSKNTLSAQLAELANADFLHVRCCPSEDGKSEIKPRIYAINCKKLFNLDIADEENPMILREPKQKRAVESRDSEADFGNEQPRSVLKEPRKVRETPPRIPPPILGDIYSINIGTKVPSIGGASLAEPSPKVDVFAVVSDRRNAMLAASAARRANRPVRTTKSNANPLSQASVQDVIDTAMAKHCPTLPRVIVSAKPLGVLKKRLVDAKIDLDAFVNWAVEFWQTTANSHERASRRRVAETSKFVHQPLPATPDFATLCYRFPYFVACYRSHIHLESAGMAVTKEQQLEQQVAKLQRTVVAARQEAQSATERERNLRRKVATAPAPEPRIATVRRTVRPVPVPLEQDDDIPAWDDFPVPKRINK